MKKLIFLLLVLPLIWVVEGCSKSDTDAQYIVDEFNSSKDEMLQSDILEDVNAQLDGKDIVINLKFIDTLGPIMEIDEELAMMYGNAMADNLREEMQNPSEEMREFYEHLERVARKGYNLRVVVHGGGAGPVTMVVPLSAVLEE